MRKGRDGGEKNGKKQKKNGGKKEKRTDENSGHYVIASSRTPHARAKISLHTTHSSA